MDGHARVFDAADLTVLRVFAELVKRFKRWDLALWKARAAVLYLDPYIRDAVRGSRRLVLVVDNTRGLCELRAPVAVGAKDDVLHLNAIHAEMRRALEAQRKDEPEIWTGRAFARRPELVTA